MTVIDLLHDQFSEDTGAYSLNVYLRWEICEWVAETLSSRPRLVPRLEATERTYSGPEDDEEYTVDIHVVGCSIAFEDDADAALFKLRWC